LQKKLDKKLFRSISGCRRFQKSDPDPVKNSPGLQHCCQPIFYGNISAFKRLNLSRHHKTERSIHIFWKILLNLLVAWDFEGFLCFFVKFSRSNPSRSMSVSIFTYILQYVKGIVSRDSCFNWDHWCIV
jgi:hypothetical protein